MFYLVSMLLIAVVLCPLYLPLSLFEVPASSAIPAPVTLSTGDLNALVFYGLFCFFLFLFATVFLLSRSR